MITMYDIKIFLEKNGQFWACANMWTEKIYAVWDDSISLMTSLNEWVILSNEARSSISDKASSFSNFLQTH